jgi:hypothetical protein
MASRIVWWTKRWTKMPWSACIENYFIFLQALWGLFPTYSTTQAKISHLVTSRPTSRQQVVFALLVPSCQPMFGTSLLTTCNNLVDIIRYICSKVVPTSPIQYITILLQPCVVNLVTFLLYHDCIRLVRTTL